MLDDYQLQPPPSNLPSVFLSYGRADDENFVRRLHGELTKTGFRVWWDRLSMPSRSLTFHQEIRDAIEAHDRVFLVLGPRAVKSEYVRAEWQYALAADKVLSLVLRLGTSDIVPAELKSLHFVDATENRSEEEALTEIFRIAKNPSPPVGRPFHVPSPPPHFQPRVDQFTRLASRFVLNEAEQIALPSSRRTVILQGMAGLGKSVLAASLAKATATRRLFLDGVVWLSFNMEDKSPLQQLQDLGVALGDDLRQYATEKHARETVRRRLEKAAVLLVLDNVWWDEQTYPFRDALGRRCQMLVTSRDAGLATRLGAELIPLDLLSEEESRMLVADWVGIPPASLSPLAQEVANQCDRLPFALAIVGAMAAAGTAWEDLSKALKAANLDFVKTKFPNYPYTDLLRAQQVSLEVLLRADDPALVQAAEKYLQISAFRWERPVPEAAIVTRWLGASTLGELEARQALTTLANKALLRTEGASPHRRFFLHDLQQDFLIARVPNQPAEHAALLDSYAKRYPGAPLALSDDGYYFDSLFHHLERAGRGHEMHPLLRRETKSGRNAWWVARIGRGQAFGYEADVQRARVEAAARATLNTNKPDPTTVALLARYALMIGSIRDALGEVPIPLIRSLVANKLWTPAQAVAAARWRPDQRSRAEGLAAVLPWLEATDKENIADDALAIIRTFPEPSDKARALLRVAEGFDGEKRLCILREVVELTREDLPGNRVEHLKTAWSLHPSSTEWLDLAIEALVECCSGPSPAYYIGALARVVPEAYVTQILRLARALTDDAERGSALLAITLASPLPRRAALAAEACEAARGVRRQIRIELLARAAQWLADELRVRVIAEVLPGLDDLTVSERTVALLDIVPVLKGVDRTRVQKALAEGLAKLQSAGTVSSLIEQLEVRGGLKDVEPAFVQSLIEPFVLAVRRDTNRYSRAKALAALGSFVLPARHKQLLEEEERHAMLIEDRDERVKCLTLLCQKLDERTRTTVVEHLLSPPLPNLPLGLAPELGSLMRMATPDQLERASAGVRSTEADSDLAAAFAIGFAHCGRWDQVYEMLYRTSSAHNVGLALKDFPESIPSEVARNIIDGSVAVQDAELIAKTIPPLVRHLQGEEREQRLRLAVHALDYLRTRHDRTRLAHDLLPELPCDMIEDLRRRLEEKPDDFEENPHALCSRLAYRLVHCGRANVAINVLKKIRYAEDLAPSLAEIAEIAGPLKASLAEWAETVVAGASPVYAVQTLVRLAALAERAETARLLEKASAIATGIAVENEERSMIDPKEEKARALLSVAPFLSEDRRRELLLEAWRLAPKGGAFTGQAVLKGLSPHLGRLSPQDLVGPWQENLMTASRHRAAVLEELASLPDVVECLGGSAAITEIVTAIEDVARWWPDANLAILQETELLK